MNSMNARMGVALDTNILAYAEGVNGSVMKRRAITLLEQLAASDVFLPVQVLGELAVVLTRKAGRSRRTVEKAILSWIDAYPTIDTSATIMTMAITLAADHKLGMWDAVILAASASAGCRLLLSQDLQDGFTWNGVTVANPFVENRHPLLQSLLQDLPRE